MRIVNMPRVIGLGLLMMALLSLSVLPVAFSVATGEPAGIKPLKLSSKPAPTAPVEKTPVNGTWQVEWVGGSKSEYSGDMILTAQPGNKLEGVILWKLQATQRDDLQTKVGQAATEYVRGTYDPGSKKLILEGYQKDDSRNVIGLDKYRLLLSDDGKVMGGITYNHGTWLGRFWAKHL